MHLALDERRAKAALHYLTILGAPATKRAVIGYGKEKPAVAGHGESVWEENRRDEFVMQKQ